MHRSSSLFWPLKAKMTSFNLYTYIKKNRLGLSRVYPGRLGPRSTGFRQANFQVGFCLDLDRSHARVGGSRVDPPGRSEFQNYDGGWNIGDLIDKLFYLRLDWE
jgi:hypothetical protein